MFPVDWPVLRVHGPDAATWLNGIVTCNVLSVSSDKAIWGSLLNKHGKVQADLQIVGAPDELRVVVSGGDAAEVLSVLDGYLVMEDAEIEESEFACLLIAGEKAKASAVSAGLSPAALNWALPSVYIACAQASDLSAAVGSGAEFSIGSDDLAQWFTQMGVPQYGVDYSAQDNLHAATLERRTVDWSKGCYLGQEVVCMQDMRGKVKRRLVQLAGAADAVLASGAEIRVQGEGDPVGTVTSVAGSLALASVRAPHFDPGTELVAGEIPVVVRALLPG